MQLHVFSSSACLLSAKSYRFCLNCRCSQQTIDVKGCGKTMGCSRMPAGCNDPVEDCEYFFTQEANRKTGLVRFEICASVAGWAAFGYNSNHTMVSR